MIRQVRPDRVLCPSPERNYARMGASHPDHRAVGAAALDAVYPDARNPFAFPGLLSAEGLAPWKVREVWLSSGPAAGHHADITRTFPRKIAALRAHRSQTGHMADLEELPRRRAAWVAEQGGLAPGHLAEAFQVMDTA